MITEQYLQCLKELENNGNIGFIEGYEKKSTANFTQDMFEYEKEDIADMAGIQLKDEDIESLNLATVSIAWRSLLGLPGVVLRGGFTFNGTTDALIFSTDYFKNSRNVESGNDYAQKLGWFEYLPIDDYMRGCFIKEPGIFPPSIAFCNAGANWYAKLEFDYYKYIELLFQNYGFKGWQYFYMDIVKEIPNLDEVLDDMRVAVKTLPLLFPDKDWSYHQQRYDEVVEKMK